MWPSYERGEEHCYSGGWGIRPDDGLLMLFYTSIGHEYREEWASVSRDEMVTWQKLQTNPLVAHTAGSGERFSAQDPFVFQHEGKTWLLSTSFTGKDKLGALHLYEATDGTLTNRQYRGRFSDHKPHKINAIYPSAPMLSLAGARTPTADREAEAKYMP